MENRDFEDLTKWRPFYSVFLGRDGVRQQKSLAIYHSREDWCSLVKIFVEFFRFHYRNLKKIMNTRERSPKPKDPANKYHYLPDINLCPQIFINIMVQIPR